MRVAYVGATRMRDFDERELLAYLITSSLNDAVMSEDNKQLSGRI